jgi:hypothetical protein
MANEAEIITITLSSVFLNYIFRINMVFFKRFLCEDASRIDGAIAGTEWPSCTFLFFSR